MPLTTIISATLKGYQVKQLLRKVLLTVDADPNHHTRGFTIIEVIVILAIIAVLATVATLKLPEWQKNMNLRATARDVVSYLQFAKLEAAKRNDQVSIEFTEGGGGVGKCRVLVSGSGETLRESTMPANITLTPPTTPVTTFKVNTRGIPVEGGGETVSLSNGSRTYNVVLSAAGAVSLNGPL